MLGQAILFQGERDKCQIEETNLLRNRGINKKKSFSCIYLGNREASQYLKRTREQVPPGRASIKDSRRSITTKKTTKLDLFKKIL